MGAYGRLNRAFLNAPMLPLSNHSRYVLMSDCHRGIGNSSDNFLKNQHLYFAALEHYYRKGFTYIELGDGDELWENRSMKNIMDIHSNVFWLFNQFYEENRLYLLYGNHDIVKRKKRLKPLLSPLCFHEGIILTTGTPPNGMPRVSLYLTHGHQASALNSTLWPLSRFLVRYVWNPLENLGVLDPTSAAKNYRIKNPPRCITCIEIERLSMTLVKWCMNARADSTLYVAREIIAGPVPLQSVP